MYLQFTATLHLAMQKNVTSQVKVKPKKMTNEIGYNCHMNLTIVVFSCFLFAIVNLSGESGNFNFKILQSWWNEKQGE